MCRCKESLLAVSHQLHLADFISSRNSPYRLVKDRMHNGQVNGRSASWTFLWRVKCSFLLKAFEQISQRNGRIVGRLMR